VRLRETLYVIPLSVLLVTQFACGSTDDGFVGTWGHAAAGESRTEIGIRKEGGGYHFVVNRWSVSGDHLLRCARDGKCAYFDGEAPYYELDLSVRDRSDDGALYVDGHGAPLPGKQGTPMEWVERITLSPDGKTLQIQRIEINGEPVEEKAREYERLRSSLF
jgi:hypothetical protein